MKEYASLLARILLSAVFLVAGMNKIMNPVGTQQYMAAYKMPFKSLLDWRRGLRDRWWAVHTLWV